MVICIGEVLTAPELERVRHLLDGQRFVDGQATAGWAASPVKRNTQLDSGAESFSTLQELVTAALRRNAVFVAAAMPKAMRSILFNRYDPGMQYGNHVDNALMGEGAACIRSDLSFTLFLSAPETYQGGELVIDDPSGEQMYKLPAGALVLYSSTMLHRVDPVASGQRFAAVGWVQSLIRDPAQRQILFELESARRQMFEATGKTAAFDLLSKNVSNLWRMWAEV